MTGFCAQAAETDLEQVKGTEFEPVHWAYSTFFGTGWYRVEDARSVYVFRVPLRQVLRESAISATGKRTTGIEVKYPLTVGLHDIDDLGGILQDDNFGTFAFAPGVVLESPVTPNWHLRTFAHFGWGKEFEGGDSAWIYSVGLKSRYRFPSDNRYQWYLFNGFYFAGYSPDLGRSDDLLIAETGVEFQQPLKRARLMNRPIDLHWNLMYSFLGNNLRFSLPDGSFRPVENQFEVGLQASFRDGPFKFLGMNIHRLGIGYRFSSSGEFSAITFSTRSWFTK